MGDAKLSEGILPDPKKNTVKNYPPPRNSDELKRFVAFVNYYRKFIKNFADITYPLNLLSKKNVPFDWDENCQKSFETFQICIYITPCITIS